ncbi:hypothetical protein AB0B45_09140 [Nonomuraea sp. NPDC049152]|uniref:hypothetical protein n=1 Tax=Nonomuraea sp. NPDC049152 TaxID=3154350 RepID=UPI0033ED330E
MTLMAWIYVAVAAGVAGLAVLGFVAVRVLVAAKELSAEIRRASAQLTAGGITLRAQKGANESSGDESGLPAAYDRR